MRFSAAVGRELVGSEAAHTLGRVSGFVVDPIGRRVVAVRLTKTESGKTLPWSNISAFGDDAVIVGGPDAIPDQPNEEIEALTGKDHELIGKRVLTSAGNELGIVDDLDFDPASGAITSLLLDTGNIGGGRLFGVGSYAVVVDAQ